MEHSGGRMAVAGWVGTGETGMHAERLRQNGTHHRASPPQPAQVREARPQHLRAEALPSVGGEDAVGVQQHVRLRLACDIRDHTFNMPAHAKNTCRLVC